MRRRLLNYSRAALKYRASRLAELSLSHIYLLWQNITIEPPTSMRRDLVEAWSLSKYQSDLVALPQSLLEDTIKKNADCFASKGINDLVDQSPCIPVSPVERKYLARFLFENMSPVRPRCSLITILYRSILNRR